MRLNRSFLALAPVLLGACGDNGDTVGAVTPFAGDPGASTEMTDGQPSGGSDDGPADGDAVTPPVGEGPAAGPGADSEATPDGDTTFDGTGEADPSGGSMSGEDPDAVEVPPVGPMTCPYTPPEDPATFPQNWTSSDVTLFNNNGGWTWYNDERVVVDQDAGKIVVSSAASNGSSNIDAVIHDLATGVNDRMVLGSLSYADDHNNGGIVIKAPGEYFVAWAHHNVDCNTYWRNYGNGGWSQQVTHQWGEGCPWGTRPDEITYNNPWKMSSEGRYYNFIRSVETSPGFLFSEDEGQTWTYGGRLTASAQQGYNAGYYKYWGNGVDRIDFFATEAHPRDADTSVFHGYIQGGKTYDSFGEEQDGNLFDDNAPAITEFTNVFRAGTAINGATLNALWNFDVARYDDGTIGVLWQGRQGARGKGNTNPNHRIVYSRFDGTAWSSTYLVRGGRTLYRDVSDWYEEDYLGGAALDPDDPHVIYVSSPIDPRDDTTTYPNHEIWKGVTCDDGASFQWTPMTMNSQSENLRPVVPKWDAQNTALLWFRGNYQTAQRYTAQVVGIVSRQ